MGQIEIDGLRIGLDKHGRHHIVPVQGRRRSWHCGAHTLINAQETCFVTGLVTARQLGADYPFEDEEARKWFNFYGRTMYGRRLRRA